MHLQVIRNQKLSDCFLGLFLVLARIKQLSYWIELGYRYSWTHPVFYIS